MFRKDFVWGVASSAYQVEGRDKNDGAGTCIWDTFTEEGRTFEHHNAYVSADDMHRYKEDYALMRELGVKAYRFSVSWARLMPEGTGRVNEKAVALYRDMILEMKKNGIEPYMTLYHWELPQALEDKGGWLNEEIIDWFAEYAKVVAENFTDICDKIFTLNEPQCFIGLDITAAFTHRVRKSHQRKASRLPIMHCGHMEKQLLLSGNMQSSRFRLVMRQPVEWHIRQAIPRKILKLQRRSISVFIMILTTGPGMYPGILIRSF